MNCNNCNSLLKDGAKFCTVCGTKVAEVVNNNIICKNCKQEIRVDAKFCTKCGEPVHPKTYSIARQQPKGGEDFNVIKNKLIWNMQPGEVARVITEEEFLNYREVVGLVINEGTKALIRINGEVVAEIKSGNYDFVDIDALNKELGGGGFLKTLKEMGTAILNIFNIGEKSKDSKLALAISKLQKGSIFSVVLTLDIPITLLYGAEQSNVDDYAVFKPMVIPTKYLDINLGLRAQFTISSITEFVKQYLITKTSISTSALVAETTVHIIAAIKQALSDVEVANNTLPLDASIRIEERIKLLNTSVLSGLSFIKIVEVSIQNEDLERFRKVSKELYLTEKELDYLQRTNNFKNRLAGIENEAIIQEAQSDLDLRRSLQKINKDECLSDDELEQFYTILSREKIIREARSEDEIEAALYDIAQTKLVREEDINILRNKIATNTHSREFALGMMQLKDKITYQQTLSSAEYQMKIDSVKADVEQVRVKDDYTDERARKRQKIEEEEARLALDLQRQQAEQELSLEERRSKTQMDDFLKMAALKQDMQAQKHNEEMQKLQQEQMQEQAMQRLKIEKEQVVRESAENLSAEQLMALAANDNLDDEAAREFARSFSAGKEAQNYKDSAEKVDKINQARVDDMKEMMRMMMEHNQSVTSSLAYSKEESKNEYKERLAVEQQRLDKTQDSALNYTTRTTPAPQQPQIQVSLCKSCGVQNPVGSKFCENCGKEM